MYDRILLPTDGERGADRATEHAIELAAAVDATVHTVYVVDETVYGAYSGDEFVAEHEGPQSTLEAAGEAALGAVTEAADRQGVAVETATRYGRPPEEIATAADDIEADLLVVGTLARRGEYGQLVGHVAERVLALTDRPVAVVKTPAE